MEASIKRFFQQAYFYHKGRRAAFKAEEFVFFQIGYPLVTLIFYCLIASYSNKTSDLGRWVVGNSFLLCVNSCVFGLGTIFMGERMNGRLRSIVAAPCSKLMLILANGLFPAIRAFIVAVLGLAVGSFVFGVDYSGVNIFMILAAVLCAMFAASCFGVFLAVIGLISDSMHLILNLVNGVLLIFTGAEFAIEKLPACVRWISQLLPLTKAIKATEGLFEGSSEKYALLLIAEALTGVFYACAARLIFGAAERAARSKGTLDMF